MDKWIPITTALPKERGKYLVTEHHPYGNSVCIVSFANDLHEVDDYDFEGKHYAGWYYMDSEYGFIEVSDVIAWRELPEPYKEN